MGRQGAARVTVMDAAAILFDEDSGGRLILKFPGGPTATSGAVDAAALQRKAAEQGYEDLLFDRGALDAAAGKIRNGEALSIQVAARTDASYAVEVAADKMTAWLIVHPGHGGKRPNAHDAVAALAAQRVKEGVDAAAVEAAIAECGQRREVARGTPPRPGKDGYLAPLVDVNRQRHPHIDETGHVDFHDLGSVPAVKAGDPIMRRHPPEKGVPGMNVFGEPVPATDGRDAQFAVRLQGVTVSADDPDLLLAEIAGQPLLQRDGISVEPILRYDVIDLSAGNIDFPGSLIVRGDIRSGMKVHAGGDITVEGVIESAEVSAGGDIRVQGGIVGHASAQHSTQRPAGDIPTARISAHGNVSARYIENAVVEAQQSVHVIESIVQSDVMALDQVVVGGKGQKGRILGGFIRATGLVSADHLGGDGAAPTRVMAGVNPLLQRAMEEHRRKRDALLKQHEDVSKIVKLLKGHPEKKDVYDKARLTLKKLSEDIAEELEDERVIEAEGKLAEHAKVVVGEAVAAGVTVVLGRRSLYIKEDAGRGVFTLDAGGEVGFSTLARGHRPK